MYFNKKIIWITGASSGIGEALARILSEMGASLIISSNDLDELENVERKCRLNGPVKAVPIDLMDHSELPGIAETVLKEWGHVDVLINNGGISQRSLAVETEIGIDKRIMDIDYFGHIILTKAVLPSMIERGSGHIVVTSSIMGRIGAPLRSAYCAAKHALHGFFDSLRTEIWKQNILVTIVCPAGVRTKISLHALTADGNQYGQMDSIIEQGITPEECARKIIRAIISQKEEIVVGKGKARYAVPFKRYLPGLFSCFMRKANPV